MLEASVVVPTHNRSEMLALTLRSVVWQQEVDFEVVVVDDGGTDNTPDVVSALGDPRIRLVRHDTPKGVAAARNRGTFEAQGEWVAFVDDDDLWAPDKLARQLEAARETGRSWAYTGAVSVGPNLGILGGVPPPPPEEVVKKLPRFNIVPGGGSNVAVLRETLVAAGPFETRLRNTEDWEMWIRLAKLGPPAWVCSPLMAYRVHSGNASLDIDEIIAGVSLIERRHDTRVDWGVIHRWIAESCLRLGRRGDALRHFATAARHGQAGNVAQDLVTIVGRRLGRYLPAARTGQPYRHPDWVRRAQAWLEELTVS